MYHKTGISICSKCHKRGNLAKAGYHNFKKQYRSYCEKCWNKRCLEYYYKHKNIILSYRKKWNKNNKDKIILAQKKWRSKNPERVRKSRLKSFYRSMKNPIAKMKWQVGCKVRDAVQHGRMKRLPCEMCGSKKVEGHHDDYSKPLEVRWLCPRHHREHHKLLKLLNQHVKA